MIKKQRRKPATHALMCYFRVCTYNPVWTSEMSLREACRLTTGAGPSRVTKTEGERRYRSASKTGTPGIVQNREEITGEKRIIV